MWFPFWFLDFIFTTFSPYPEKRFLFWFTSETENEHVVNGRIKKNIKNILFYFKIN